MKCPSCSDTELVVTTRNDIEIDLCTRCRGVWLDRGELDKIVARSAAPDPDRDDDDFEDEARGHRASDGGGPHSRRRSWWAELFD